MRLLLSETSVVAISTLQERFKNANPDVETSIGPFIEKLILCLENELSPDQIKEWAHYLISPKLKRKRMRQRLAELAEHVDDNALAKLERRLDKLESQVTETQKNQPILAEKV